MKFIQFIHPVVMLGFFYFLYLQRNLGRRILVIKDKSPDFKHRGSLIEVHRGYGYALTAIALIGLLAGIFVTTSILGATSPFLQTYGHGLFGSLILACIVTSLVLGLFIKHVKKPKIRDRFFEFHSNMVYIIAIFGLLSLLTGAIVLGWGLGATS